jgi:hypothetical protein
MTLALLLALVVCGLLCLSLLCWSGQVRRSRRGPRLLVVRPREAPELQVPEEK